MATKRTVDLQIRKVPEVLRDRLRRRAKGKGMSMSAYVIEVLNDDLERPTMAEWVEEVRRLPSVGLPPGVTGATIVREAREERDRELEKRFDRTISRLERDR